MPNLVLPGFTDPKPVGQNEITLAFGLDYSLPTGNYTLPVPAGYAVANLGTIVTTVFDGSPTLTVGDSTTAAGYLSNANVALGTAATAGTPAVKKASANGGAYANGKLYYTADSIILAWTKGTSPTTGVLKGWVNLVPLADLGLSTSASAV